MGEARREALRVGFDRSIKLEFHGAKVSSDGGLVTYRDLDEALQLTAMAKEKLTDFRTGDNIQHDLVALLRQSVFSRLAGYEDTNDADRLRVDPTMRVIVGGRAKKRLAASTSQMSWFETEVLTQLAYNLGNFLRRLALPRSVKHWSLTTLRDKLIKIGAKIVRRHGT
ncbi:MAG: transposase [Phycisphaerae bacterium]